MYSLLNCSSLCLSLQSWELAVALVSPSDNLLLIFEALQKWDGEPLIWTNAVCPLKFISQCYYLFIFQDLANNSKASTYYPPPNVLEEEMVTIFCHGSYDMVGKGVHRFRHRNGNVFSSQGNAGPGRDFVGGRVPTFCCKIFCWWYADNSLDAEMEGMNV